MGGSVHSMQEGLDTSPARPKSLAVASKPDIPDGGVAAWSVVAGSWLSRAHEIFPRLKTRSLSQCS